MQFFYIPFLVAVAAAAVVQKPNPNAPLPTRITRDDATNVNVPRAVHTGYCTTGTSGAGLGTTGGGGRGTCHVRAWNGWNWYEYDVTCGDAHRCKKDNNWCSHSDTQDTVVCQ
ncbi:hypothetical protein F4779DRAFT_617287 [Xylariaceae sp. FL0662B]|nr:hypothetical protein F4779DRAFT_617287 [Xylariaceae sp. FL0662B]